MDCQTWLIAIVGPAAIDTWFGEGTTMKVWEKLKSIGGYGCDDSNKCKGVGFSHNEEDQVI